MLSLQRGTIMNPFKTQSLINAVSDERTGRGRLTKHKKNFGTGTTAGGNANYTAPVHGTTLDGRPVTISFGRGEKFNQTLVCDGHVDMQTFYARRTSHTGHDHFLVDGKIASKRDVHRFK